MANLMLVQCEIASHAEVWTCQILEEILSGLTVTIVQVLEGMAGSTSGQHYVQYKRHADQRRSFKLSFG